MFSDQDYPINRKFFPAEREGFTNGWKDRNAFRFAHFLTQSAFWKLMDVSGRAVVVHLLSAKPDAERPRRRFFRWPGR